MNGDRRYCLKAILLTGLLLFLLPPAVRAEAGKDLDLRLMTFNIRYGTADDGPNHWQKRREMVFDVLRKHDAQIVGLQEALRLQIDEICAAMPGYGEIGVGRDDGKTKSEYCAILYDRERFSVDESGTFWFSDTPEVPGSITWGNANTRICTWARFIEKASGRSFYIYNLHLDHVSQPSREKGAVLLAQRIKSRNHPDPFVVMGDFNAGENNPAIMYLKGKAKLIGADGNESTCAVPMVDTFRVLHADANNVGTFNGFKGNRDGDKIDFILTTDQTNQRPTMRDEERTTQYARRTTSTKVLSAEIIYDNIEDRYPSDHFPVAARLSLTASQAASSVLKTLDKNHPRLMLKDKDLENLKARYAKDELLQKCVKDVIKQADRYLGKSKLTYQKIGPRLLHVSRDCLNRTYALALAYRWTGKDVYAKAAVENLLAVCDFKDWNPSHFLDTAEMSHAVGVGYDWLYHYMDAPTRQTIKAGLIKNGLEEGVAAYGKLWWHRSEFNWNQVCNGGLIAGALAIAESDPQYADQIVPAAVKSLPIALKSYGPDGAWGEGPGYWSYATHYTAYGIAALQTALGTDFGLLQTEGLSDAGSFPIYTAGPTGLYLNFADVGDRSARRPMPCMFWLSQVFNNPLYAEDERALLSKYDAGAGHVIWYVPAASEKPPAKQLDRYYHGPVEVAVMRSAWGDPNALFVGVKAGFNQVNHGHLDLGNFELDALGVRWARDLGSDNYNLPNYWDSGRDGKRWSYYRLNSKSHNVVLLGGQDQDPLAKSKFLKFESKADRAYVVVDLTEAYAKFAKTSTRGVAMVENRRAVLIQDEFQIDQPTEVTWGMTTDAKIRVAEDGAAGLTLRNKQLAAHLLSPAGARFTVESAEQKPPQEDNAGVSRLIVRVPNAKGSVCVAVLLSPVSPDGRTISAVSVKPLDQW